MPESVTDRPTKSHEYLFLLTKSARYYFDADAVREPHVRLWNPDAANGSFTGSGVPRAEDAAGRIPNPAGRNIRSVWTIATRPYPGAHFAVFPPELPERCIKAGSSERGVCPECGAPWVRIVTVVRGGSTSNDVRRPVPTSTGHNSMGKVLGSDTRGLPSRTSNTIGWQQGCACTTALKQSPAVVLDPFAGSGTVGLVANRISRRAILIDLNPAYLEQQMRRNAQTPLGLAEGDVA